MERKEKYLVDYRIVFGATVGVILLKRIMYYVHGYATFEELITMMDYSTVDLIRMGVTFTIPLVFAGAFSALFSYDTKRELQVSGFLASFISILPVLIFEELRPWTLVEAHKMHLLYILYACYIIVYVSFMGVGAGFGPKLRASLFGKESKLVHAIVEEVKKSWRTEIAAFVAASLFYYTNKLISVITENF